MFMGVMVKAVKAVAVRSFVHYVNEDNIRKKYFETVPFGFWLRYV